MKTKVKEGDLFSVPLDHARSGYGQVIEIFEKVLIYCAFYPDLLSKGTGMEPSTPLLAGITASAKIKNGDWPLLGNELRNLQSIKRPNFKVTIGGSMYIEDFAMKVRRKITEEESDILSFRSIVAPIRYQKALCAHFGLEDWEREYDRLLYENVIRSHCISVK